MNEGALEEMIQLSSISFNSAVMDYKKQGKKVIGFFCSYIPEEIIYAGGMLPYRIRPAACQGFGRTFGVAL